MLAGTCNGVDGSGPAACVNTGFSPNWLMPAAFATQITGLFLAVDEVVCPWCLLDRADAANVPGFNKQKYNRIRALLDGFNCSRVGGSRSAGHCHLFDFESENLWSARGHEQLPSPTERGY